MPKLHEDITDPEIHEPKGFAGAANNTALTKNATGTLEFVLTSTIGGGDTGPTGPAGPSLAAWVTATGYFAGDTLYSAEADSTLNKIYLCTVNHTSGASLLADIANWQELSESELDHTALTNIGTKTHATLDTEVDLNNAKVSADGLVTTHSDVTDAGSGAIITTTERNAVGTNTSNNTGSATVHSDIAAGDITNLGNLSGVNTGDGVGEGTGVLTGGVLFKGLGATEYSIADGTGQIVDENGVVTSVSWSGNINITPTNIGTQLITFVGIDSGSNVVESTTRFSNTQSRSIIVLGVIIHVDNATVDNVNNEQSVAYNTNNQLIDLYEAIGFFNISGNVFSANGANMVLNKSVGSMSAHGSNYPNDSSNPNVLVLPSLVTLSFQYRFSNGANGTTGPLVDPANLDDGAGGLTALSSNQKWSVQRIYSFTSNNVKIQRGVTEFDSQDQALAGISSEPYITEPSIAANGLLRGWLVCKKNATDLTNSAQAIFIDAPKFQGSTGGIGSVASTLQDVYNNSQPNPEMLTDTTNGALTIRRGSAADTDTVFEGQNGAGTTTASIKGDGDATFNEVALTGQGYSDLNTLSDAVTIATDCALGNVHEVTLTDNRTLGAPTNLKAGATYLWIITQDGVGSRTLVYNAVFKFPGGIAPTLSTDIGAVDILSGVSDGTNVYCNLLEGFS